MGGKPRKYPAPRSAFKAWLEAKLAAGASIHALAKILEISPSTIYNLRNGYFPPGLKLAVRIAEASRDSEGISAVPVESWT